MATYSHNSNDLTPLMTANNTPSPNVVSASSALWPAYGAFAHSVVFGIGQVWLSENGQTTGWLKFDFGSGNTHIVLKYTLSFYSGSSVTRAPKSWTLQGSNNDVDWDVLDTQTNVIAWSSSEMRTYSFANSTDYRYYKLNITANQGDNDYVTVGELELIGDESVEISLTNPISAQANLQSNIQIELVVPAFTAQSELSVGEIFWGSFVECPSPFEVTTSLHAKTGLEIAINPLIAQANLQSNIQIELVVPAFTAQSELSVGEIFWGYEIDFPEPFTANALFQANTQIELVTAPLIATSALLSNIGIEISAGVLNNTGSILGTPVYPIILTGSKRIYIFTLTGAADGVDDIIIPIKSFQSRLKSGDPTYLSIVISGTDYASEINLRLNGDLVVRMGYLSNSEIILSEIISIVDFENIIIYDGTINKTITLDGHRTETFTPKEINLTGSSYKNLTAGKLRYRCTPNLYVRPGDTVNIDNDSFTIENITYSVSPELETFEVSE